ncbi:MAG TPA: zinc ribbon domain-containing protein [Longimicrobium sp.]|nr:zinc ribbon domain-containing protein [Longimicrobium sp.]
MADIETPSETCPACGAAASGRFCDHCGVALSAACRECGNPLPRGAKFCNMCGAAATPSAAPAAARPSVLPWAVAALALLALIAVVLVPRLGGRGEQAAVVQPPFAQAGGPAAPGGAGAGAPAGNPGAVDLSSMSPREAADRLFNRVMTAVSTGDTAQARQFVPMAVMAYQRVDTLDADGRYHLAALQLVASDYPAARAQADTLLAGNPAHLFGLFTAAQAELGRGNQAAAKQLYQRFVQSYAPEIARQLPEYQEHAQGLPAMKAEAERAIR